MNILNVIKTNFVFYCVLIIIGFAGSVVGEIAFFLAAVAVILFWSNDRIDLSLQTFFFVLVLSDSLEGWAGWASTYKPFVLLLISALTIVSHKKMFKTKNSVFKSFLPYFILAVICLSFSPIFIKSFQKTLSYVLLFFCLPYILQYLFSKRGSVFCKELIVFFFMIVLAGFVFKYLTSGVATSHGGRFRGVFGNPNGLGIYLIVITGFTFICRQKIKNLFTQYEYIFIAMFFLYASYISGSRTSLMVIILFFSTMKIAQLSPWLAVLFAIVLSLTFNTIFQLFIDLIIQLGLGEQFRVETLQEGSGRLIAWAYAWENIQNSIFLGKGIGYDEKLMRDAFAWLSRLGHEGGVHNSYLIIWLNTGLIGLVFFMRGFFLSFINAVKESSIAMPLMFGVLISISVEPWIAASLNPYTSILICSLVAMTFNFENYFNEEIQEDLSLA